VGHYHYLRGDFERHDGSFILKGVQDSGLIKPKRIDKERRGSCYFMTEKMAGFKLRNRGNTGLNRCYCRLTERIIPLLLENRV